MRLTVGDGGIKAKLLVQVTYDAMMIGIELKPGVHSGTIGKSIMTDLFKSRVTKFRRIHP